LVTIQIKKSTFWKGLVGILAIVIGIMIFNGNLDLSRGGSTTPTGNVALANSDGIVVVKTLLQGFEYKPDVITVKEGSKVRLVIDNKDSVNHGLHLPQFGVAKALQPNAINTIEFTAVDSPSNGLAMPTCTQEHGEVLTFNVV